LSRNQKTDEPLDDLGVRGQRDAPMARERPREGERDRAVVPAVVADQQADSDERGELNEDDDCDAAA